MTNISSTTKLAIVDDYRYLTNEDYNVLSKYNKKGSMKAAIKIYKTLIDAGYSRKAAIVVIRETFLVDVEHL